MSETRGTAHDHPEDHSGPVAVLRRWEDAGGVWRVVATRGDSVTVSLCRCDGGEEAERLTSADPDLVAYVNRRLAEDP
ncbi:hypothetical protein [Yinghuangia sp. YIM S09857]|uniref:hypothetical protein n=1 Tax=Yinghuangia sp. YIM S09857 TaxID=3436929 RepID=UPI003F532981